MDKVLIIIVLVLSIIGCASKKNLVEKENLLLKEGFEKLKSNTLLQEIKISKKDTLFRCNSHRINNGILFSYDKMKIDINSRVYEYAKCYCKDSFIGKRSSIEILQLLHLNHKRFLCYDYRGPELFEMVFDRSNDFIPIVSPDSPNHGKTMFERNYRKKIYDMIKSIDGFSLRSYFVLYLRNKKGLSDVEMADIMDYDNIKWAKLEYEALLFAKENNLIVLKDYEEE